MEDMSEPDYSLVSNNQSFPVLNDTNLILEKVLAGQTCLFQVLKEWK